MQSYNTILLENKEGILIIKINRPDKLNALSQEVVDELSSAIKLMYGDEQVNGVIITGSGNKSFVAGADILQFASLSKATARDLAKKGQDLMFLIENSPKPVIACVNGFALGGGCELAMACHFRIASENAVFGQPEVNIGVMTGYGGSQRLTHLVGKGIAMEWMLSAIKIDAQTALRYGLVNYVVPQNELLDKGLSILNKIKTNAPLAVAGSIKAVNATHNNDLNGYELEIDEFAKLFNTKDVLEGVQAFAEKRKPQFKGK
ncbi:MAG: enoyl-CoA hydratase-related protein [Phycisphaerales bacterium]|nr:enoyl-CoA hydratase-related protein [Phycisphaerales bacterium]